MKKYLKSIALMLVLIMTLSACNYVSPYGDGTVTERKTAGRENITSAPKEETTTVEQVTFVPSIETTTAVQVTSATPESTPDTPYVRKRSDNGEDCIFDPSIKSSCYPDRIRIFIMHEVLESKEDFDRQKEYKKYTVDDFADIGCTKIEVRHEGAFNSVNNTLCVSSMYDLYFEISTAEEVIEKEKMLESRDDVYSAGFVQLYGALSAVPNDYNLSTTQQWAIERINLPGAWDIRTNSTVKVGIIDTGIDLNNEDLANRVDTTLSTTFTDAYFYTDVEGNGSHVAGIVGAA